jgi:hypothetical protein
VKNSQDQHRHLLSKNTRVSLFNLHELFLSHTLKTSHSTHTFHHFFHLRISSHLFHHIHQISGTSKLSHNLRVDHVLQFAHNLVGISHQTLFVIETLP